MRKTLKRETYLAENGATQLRLDKKGFKHLSFHISTRGRADLLVDFSVERWYAAWSGTATKSKIKVHHFTENYQVSLFTIKKKKKMKNNITTRRSMNVGETTRHLRKRGNRYCLNLLTSNSICNDVKYYNYFFICSSIFILTII